MKILAIIPAFIVIELKRSYESVNVSHEIFLDGNLEIFSVQYLGYIIIRSYRF